jgi:hypothetical protein
VGSSHPLDSGYSSTLCSHTAKYQHRSRWHSTMPSTAQHTQHPSPTLRPCSCLCAAGGTPNSTFDDPGLESAMLPWSYFWTESSHGGMRWTMCAQDVCIGNELLR